jgi:hypothetical protein
MKEMAINFDMFGLSMKDITYFVITITAKENQEMVLARAQYLLS